MLTISFVFLCFFCIFILFSLFLLQYYFSSICCYSACIAFDFFKLQIERDSRGGIMIPTLHTDFDFVECIENSIVGLGSRLAARVMIQVLQIGFDYVKCVCV